jgi:hypothetical protein
MRMRMTTRYTGRHSVDVRVAAVDYVRLTIFDREREGRYVDLRPRRAVKVACTLLWAAALAIWNYRR